MLLTQQEEGWTKRKIENNKKKAEVQALDVTLDWANSCREAVRNILPANNTVRLKVQVGGVADVKSPENTGISQHLDFV